MRILSLRLIVMTTAGVGILGCFLMTEGCGERFARIDSLSFSSDDSTILVSKFNGRDAQTPFKMYMADIARTVSRLDATDGSTLGVVSQEHKAGNCGTGRFYWCHGRTGLAYVPPNDRIARLTFGTGELLISAAGEEGDGIRKPGWRLNLAVSRSGRRIAASGPDFVCVCDSLDGRLVVQAWAEGLSSFYASMMSFVDDDRLLVASEFGGLQLWDVRRAAPTATIAPLSSLERLYAIAAAGSDSVIVATDQWVRRLDFKGRVVAKLADTSGHALAVSADQRRLAICLKDEVVVYDLQSSAKLQSWRVEGAVSVALTSDGGRAAVGDREGRVTLIDCSSGHRFWSVSPPDRYRLPWTAPALLFGAWATASASFAWKRRQLAKNIE